MYVLYLLPPESACFCSQLQLALTQTVVYLDIHKNVCKLFPIIVTFFFSNSFFQLVWPFCSLPSSPSFMKLILFKQYVSSFGKVKSFLFALEKCNQVVITSCLDNAFFFFAISLFLITQMNSNIELSVLDASFLS